MLTFIFTTGDSALSKVRKDAPEGLSDSTAKMRDNPLNLTCMCLIRRKKGKAVSMKLLLRDYASE